MKKISIILSILISFVAFGMCHNANASEYGSDFSSYQGANGYYGSSKEIKFAFAKLGGDNFSYVNPHYQTQVDFGLLSNVRMHTYIWSEDISNNESADQLMNWMLPMVKTPKGSIVAIDAEEGKNTTDQILYMMNKIKSYGYQPMIYSSRPYFKEQGINTDKIIEEFPNSVWVAGYPTNDLDPEPLFDYFPSMNGVGIWQYSSNGALGGLDMNIDLTGITYSGYDLISPDKVKVENDKPQQSSVPVQHQTTYTVRSGDTLSGIASQFGTTYQQIANASGIDVNDFIYPGQVLVI